MTQDKRPLYEQAAEHLISLASPLFKRAMEFPEGSEKAETIFDQWYALRAAAGRVLMDRKVIFGAVTREDVLSALILVHDLAHDGDINGSPEPYTCKCETADRINEFISIIIADSQEAAEAGDHAA